jgi:hypothetical protein
MAYALDITLRRNEDWARLFRVTDGEGNPVSLAGWSVAMQVKSRLDNTTVVATGSCAITLANLGWFTVTLRASEGNPLASYGDPLQIENLPYDIRLTSPDGVKIDFVAGTIILLRGVTLS